MAANNKVGSLWWECGGGVPPIGEVGAGHRAQAGTVGWKAGRRSRWAGAELLMEMLRMEPQGGRPCLLW